MKNLLTKTMCAVLLISAVAPSAVQAVGEDIVSSFYSHSLVEAVKQTAKEVTGQVKGFFGKTTAGLKNLGSGVASNSARAITWVGKTRVAQTAQDIVKTHPKMSKMAFVAGFAATAYVFARACKKGFFNKLFNKSKISQKDFEFYKSQLSDNLKGFVDDFATWEKEDKNTIKLFCLSFVEDKCEFLPVDYRLYEGNIDYWADCLTVDRPGQRASLLACLKYLQQEE